MDIFKGEEIYENYLVFKETEPLNAAFDFFGVGDLNMINNSGSYFLIQFAIFAYMMLKISVNLLAKKCYKKKFARLMGMKVFEDNYLINFGRNSVKLFMESYFDLIFCAALNLWALVQCKDRLELESFFSTPLDVIASSLTILYMLLLVAYPIYGFVVVHTNQGKLETRKVQN